MESKFALDYVAKEIHRQAPGADVSTYTYGFAMKHKHQINKLIKGGMLITHSSGVMVIERGAQPAKAVFISPVQPVSRIKLFIRALVKTVYHSWKIISFKDRKKLLLILGSNAFEFIAHPWQNLKPFVNGDVSRFDLRKILPRHPIADSARVIISHNDEMFTGEENKLDELADLGVDVIYVDAMHDEIFIDTPRIIAAALNN